ncbi:MAG: hypothetical protein OXF28_04395 [Thaumarchaeota archaeon]|nr:hypothetical protein [Nitrososphaerota archaeon]MCY3976348.1 hypothetical protein [Nitrososphaerota archaeon]
MPKDGFKSITLSEIVYNKFYNIYKENKVYLTMKGINSFAGYITYMLEDIMEKDKESSRYFPKLKKISSDNDRIILQDNIKNRIIEVIFRNNEPYCLFCEEKNCFHIGFVFSLPEVYKILNKNGVKYTINKSAGGEI